MSHDKPRITHRYVDDRGKVHTTVLEGWPATIFCTIDKEFLEEFATRTLTDSPTIEVKKIQAAQEVTDQKTSYPWEYQQDTLEKKLIRALIRNVRDVIKKYSLKTVKPFPNLRSIIKFSNEATRDMRDYEHFNQMLLTYPALKLFQRPIVTIGDQKFTVITVEDVLAAKDLFDLIAETTRTNTEKPILDFYYNHVQNHANGATLKQILANAPEMRSERTARYYLDRLEEIGWINKREGEQDDKRLLTYYPLKEGSDPQQKLIPTTAKQQTTKDLKAELEKDFDSWNKTITTNNPLTQIEKICFNDRTLQPLTLENFKKIVIGVEPSSVVIVSNEENQPIQGKKTETTLTPEITIDSRNSEEHDVKPRLEFDGPTIQEILEILREELLGGKPFLEQDFVDCAARHGWARKEAEDLLESLKGKEKGVLMTPEGLWAWT